MVREQRLSKVKSWFSTFCAIRFLSAICINETPDRMESERDPG